MPIKAISDGSRSVVRPCCCKCSPPTPTNSKSPPKIARNPFTRSAPSRSPDSSPAIIAMFSMLSVALSYATFTFVYSILYYSLLPIITSNFYLTGFTSFFATNIITSHIHCSQQILNTGNWEILNGP